MYLRFQPYFMKFLTKLLKFTAKSIIKILTQGVINSAAAKLIGTLLIDFTVVAGSFCFIWSFYCGIADRVFQTPVGGGEATIINPFAFLDAVQTGNLLIICFPFIFLCISLLLHHYLEALEKPVSSEEENKKSKLMFWSAFGCMIAFDLLAASVSLLNFHHYHGSGRTRDYEFSLWYLMYVFLIVCCGVGISVAAGMLLHSIRKIINLKKLVKLTLDNTEESENDE